MVIEKINFMKCLKQVPILEIFLIFLLIEPFIAYEQELSIKQAPIFGEGRGTNLWGKLPPLKQYYKPPKQPVIRRPRSEKPVYDHIVVPSNPLAVIDLMNSATSILGGAIGAKELPGAEGHGVNERYIGALRLRVFKDGTFCLYRFWPYQNPEFKVNPDKVMADLNNPCNWEFLPKDDAIRALDAQLWYQYKTSGGIDKSFGQLFMGITGYQWHPGIHEGEMPKVMIGEPGNVKPGGVYIAPTPSKMGKGGTEVREKVLKSRPSDDALSWPVEIPKEMIR